MMEMIWPVGSFSEGLFKQGLSKIIKNQLNVEALANEIRSKEEANVTNLQINTDFINENLLSDSPLKIIDGSILNFKAKFPKMFLKTKIEIVISDVYLIIAPSVKTYNKNNQNQTQPKSNILDIFGAIINKVLNKLEITIKNICIKLVTYDDLIKNISFNPNITLLIGQIQYSKMKEAEGAVFLYNKKVQIDNLSVKLSEIIEKEEIFYFNVINDQTLFQKFKDNNERIKEKLFLLNNNPNTIATLTSKEENEYFSVRLKIFEDNDKQMHLQADISNIEVMLNQKQLSCINYFCKVYYRIKESLNTTTEIKQTIPTITKEINLIGTKIPMINFTVNVNLVNLVLVEGIKHNYPKLWTFLDYKYPDKLDSSEKIEKHFSYFEENYYLFLINNICFNANMVFAESRSYADFNFDKFYAKYVLHKSKSPFEKYIPENIIQTYENLDSEVKNMKNLDAKFYFGIYNNILKEENHIQLEENINSLLLEANLSQYTLINLPSLLNFYFKNTSFDFINFKKPIDQKNQKGELFRIPNKFGARLFSKLESHQEKNEPMKTKKKTIISTYLGEIYLQFHPIFLFNFMNLLNYYLPRNKDEDFTTISEKILKSKENEKTMIKNQVDENESKSIEVVKKKEENLAANNNNFISKLKFLLFVDKLSVNLFSFQSENINDFFQRYYNIYVSNLIDRKNKQIVNRILPNYLEDITGKGHIILKLINLQFFFSNKNTTNFYETNFNIDFSKLLILLKSKELFPIIHLVNTNSHDLVEINQSINSINNSIQNDPIKKQVKYNTLFDNISFENNYSRSYEKVKFSIICIKMLFKPVSELKSDIAFYYQNIHNIDLPKDEGMMKVLESHDQKSAENKSTISVKLFLRSQINLLTDSTYLLKTIEFLDSFQYTMNLFNIMKVYIQNSSGIPKINSNSNSKEILNENFLSANIEIKELNIILFNSIVRRYTEEMENQLDVGDSLFTLIEDPYLKINLSKIYLDVFECNHLKEILLSISGFRFLLKKNSIKDQPNYENSRSIYQIFCLHKFEEENFHHIVYNLSRQENCHILTAISYIYSFPNNINCTDNNPANNEILNFEKFLKSREIRATSSETNSVIKVDGLVFNPMYQDFDYAYLLLIKTNIIDPLRRIANDERKFCLMVEENASKNNVKLICSRCIIDLFSIYSKDTSQIDSNKVIYNQMRMAILLDDVVLQRTSEENFQNTIINANKINLFLLKNLDKGANKLIFQHIQEKDFKSKAFLSIYGFSEMLYFESSFIKFSKNIQEKSLELEFVNEVIEITFCRDSIKCFRSFTDSIISQVTKLREMLLDKSSDIKKTTIIEKQNQDDSNEIKNKFNLNFKENEAEVILENKIIDDHHFDVSHIQIDKKDSKHELEIEYQIKSYLLFNYIKIFLYDGKDFVFDDKYEENNLNDIEKHGLDKQFTGERIEEYYSYSIDKKTQKKIPNERLRNPFKKRNFQRFIDLAFYGIEIKLKYNCYEIIPLTLNFQVFKFEISDNIKESIFNKIFTKNNFNSENPLIYLKIDLLNRDTNKAYFIKDQITYEINIYLGFESVNILIDQYSLFFVLEFFKVFKNNQRKESNTQIENKNLLIKPEAQEGNKIVPNEKIDETTLHKVIIQKIIIEEFFVNFCYHSHKIEIKNSKNKEFMDVLNLMNLKDLKILFRNYVCNKGIILSDLFNELSLYWKKDIKNNQIINSFISSLTCVKPFKNIFESFFELYRLPYIYHVNNLDVSEGACKAFQQFFINLSTESIYLGEKIFKIFGGSCKNKENENELKKSAYDEFVHLVNENKRLEDKYLLK